MFRNLISPFVAVLAFAIAVMLYCAAFNVRTVTMNIAGRAEETPIFSSSDVATEFRRNVVESPSTAPPSSSTKEFEDYAFDYSSCVCSLSSMSHADVYKEQLSLVIPWLNLTTRQALERNHPNFPVNLLKSFDGKWCSLLPLPHLINWSNIYFQSLEVSTTTFLLYSAFFDNRELTDLRPCIRIVTYARTNSPPPPGATSGSIYGAARRLSRRQDRVPGLAGKVRDAADDLPSHVPDSRGRRSHCAPRRVCRRPALRESRYLIAGDGSDGAKRDDGLRGRGAGEGKSEAAGGKGVCLSPFSLFSLFCFVPLDRQ
ncbi:hypothetical protein C7M84_006393 [Penaeus vannamei]|uniref:Uncharacterized protein n=1 Tax=Penaeus vannamei TaxID=6689 RepID=A0A3R7P4D3_PENVA|nr:uncharacterized protein LOC113807467 [Penaeus vannamei]ROT75107.1 hypothetical protein C7M84_006393 [Penaeus vannamei]